MAKSAALVFPFKEDVENKSLLRTTTINDTLKSCITAFLLTEKGQRRGNHVGSFLPTLLHKLIPTNALLTYEQELNQELNAQFPGVLFNNIKIEQVIELEVVTLQVTIAFSTPVTDITQISLLLK